MRRPGGHDALDPAHERHDVGLVDRHPAPAVRRQRAARPGPTCRAKMSGEPGRSQNSSPSHNGWVKWCSVTMGSRPRVDAHGEDLGVALERGGVEGARAGARAGPTRPTGGRRCSRWRRRGRAPPRDGARSHRPGRSGRPGRRPPRRPSCCAARRRRCSRPRPGSPTSPRRRAKPSPRRLGRGAGVGGTRVGLRDGVAEGIRSAWQAQRAPVPPGWARSVGPGHRAHGGQRRRDDVDLVAGVAHQRAHLRLGGVAPGAHGGRLHVAGRADHLGHLAAHVGPARARRQAALQRSRPSSSSATRCSERHTAGSSATGASRDSAWATAISASSTATRRRRRTREAAPRLRSSGVARPA